MTNKQWFQPWFHFVRLERISYFHSMGLALCSNPRVRWVARRWIWAAAAATTCAPCRCRKFSRRVRPASYCGWLRNPNVAPPKKSWNDDSPAHTNKQWLPMLAKWCRISSINSTKPRKITCKHLPFLLLVLYLFLNLFLLLFFFLFLVLLSS